MKDDRKFALIRGEEKFTLDDVKYLATTFKAKKVCINTCVGEEDGEINDTYGILLTKTKGGTDWRMLQKLFGVLEDNPEHIMEFNIPFALYLGIIGQEYGKWSMEDLFSEEEIEEYKKEWEGEE